MDTGDILTLSVFSRDRTTAYLLLVRLHLLKRFVLKLKRTTEDFAGTCTTVAVLV